MTVGEGQLVALRGRSGSGKTTLLNIAGGLDAPDSGAVRLLAAENVGVPLRIAGMAPRAREERVATMLRLTDGTILRES